MAAEDGGLRLDLEDFLKRANLEFRIEKAPTPEISEALKELQRCQLAMASYAEKLLGSEEPKASHATTAELAGVLYLSLMTLGAQELLAQLCTDRMIAVHRHQIADLRGELARLRKPRKAQPGPSKGDDAAHQ